MEWGKIVYSIFSALAEYVVKRNDNDLTEDDIKIIKTKKKK